MPVKNIFIPDIFSMPLFSGYSPGSFLKAVVSRQIPADMQTFWSNKASARNWSPTQKLLAFLTMKLNQTQDGAPGAERHFGPGD